MSNSKAGDVEVSGAEIQMRRLALGMSQAQAARFLRVKQNSISQWERGSRKVPVEIVEALDQLGKDARRLAKAILEEHLKSEADVVTVKILYKETVRDRVTAFGVTVPAPVHRMASARAAATLRIRGVRVKVEEVHAL